MNNITNYNNSEFMNKKIILLSLQDNLSIIGLKYIQASLRLDMDSHLLFLPSFTIEKAESLRQFVEMLSPLFIGISLMSIEFERAMTVSRFIKAHFPQLPIICGGIHPTIDPESCLAFADYVCIGEGESVIRKFAQILAINGDVRVLESICYLKDGKLVKNPLALPQTNLDDLPYLEHCPSQSFIQKSDGNITPLDHQEYRQQARYQGAMLETIISRGCAFSCTYCCNNALVAITKQYRIRKRSVDHIIGELTQELHNHRSVKVIHFQDDSLLSCGEKYLEAFCSRYKSEIDLPFIVHTIPIYINERKLSMLKKAGIQWLNMGLQSGSDRVLEQIYQRKSYRRHFLQAAKLVQDYKIAGKYDVILDNPLESDEEKLITIETMLETPRPHLFDYFSLTCYKGTEIYERFQKEIPQTIEMRDHSHDFSQCRNSIINSLTFLAPYLPLFFMKILLSVYRKHNHGLYLHGLLFVARWSSLFLFQPIMFCRVLLVAHNDSWIQMGRGVRIYLSEGIKTYVASKVEKN